jgi:hypothetical protein
MNWFKIITELEKVDPEVFDRMDTRRKAMSEFGSMGKKIAVAALPLAMASMFKKAYGKTTDAVNDVLNFALALEYLEAEFYTVGVANASAVGIPTGPALTALTKIRNDETAHVAFLKSVLATNAIDKPNIDLTGGGGTMAGPFLAALSNYDVYLAAAQTFEDTGVRAYKGQAGNLVTNNVVLTAALQIHSVEARHASHIRQMRAARAVTAGTDPTDKIDPWITLKSNGAIPEPYGTAVQSSYNGEENTTQAGVNVAGLSGANANSASEAFDEPLTKEAVLAITGTPGAGLGTATAKFFY